MRHNRFSIIIAAILTTATLFTSCGSKDAESLDLNDLIDYGITVKDNMYGPSLVDFDMTVDEVIEAKKLTEESIFEDSGVVMVLHDLKISGINGEMREIYRFHDGKLVTVTYSIPVNTPEKEKVCNSLYEQAAEALPAPSTNDLSELKKGTNLVGWRDENQNRIEISFPKVADGEPEIVMLSIYKGVETSN